MDAFNEYVLRTYTARLYGHVGAALTVKSERTIARNDIVVDTRIQRPSAGPLEVQWRIRDSEADYRVVDVVVTGMSVAVTHRDEFAAVVKRQQVTGLIELLRSRASTPSEAVVKIDRP